MVSKTSRSACRLALLLPLSLSACGRPAPPGPQPLRVTAIPDANKDTLREDQARIAGWLSAKAGGVPVEFMPVENYAAAVTAIVHAQADMAWLGGVTTVQALQQSGGHVRPLVMRESDLRFKSHIIAGAGLGIRQLADLKGHSFSFGSKSSTSGHVMPRFFLQQQGLMPERDFSRAAYSGDHTKTVLDVASGAVDAGAVNYKYFDRMIAEGKADPKKVVVVWTTPEYVDYAWVVRDDLDSRCGQGATKRIADAFLALDPTRPDDRAILAIQQAERYVEARTEMWDSIRSVVEKIDVGS